MHFLLFARRRAKYYKMAAHVLGRKTRGVFRDAYRRWAKSNNTHFDAKNTLSTSSTSNSDTHERGFLRVQIAENTGVVTMAMNRPQDNALNAIFLQNIAVELENLERNEMCRALILTSDNPQVFCSGLEVPEMYYPNINSLREYWRSVQEVWLKLYGSKLITFAAITGHLTADADVLSLSRASAGVLAFCTDYRVMADESTIHAGFQGVVPGNHCPSWFIDTLRNTIGQRETEYALQRQKIYTAQAALEKRLVDKVVPQSEVMDAVHYELTNWLRIPDFARQITKHKIHRKTLEQLQDFKKREEDIDNFVNYITQKKVQMAIEKYLAKQEDLNSARLQHEHRQLRRKTKISINTSNDESPKSVRTVESQCKS